VAVGLLGKTASDLPLTMDGKHAKGTTTVLELTEPTRPSSSPA
jgi:hypothetical protein